MSEPDRQAQRSNTRFALGIYIIAELYLLFWGNGIALTDRCEPSLASILQIVVFGIPFLYLLGVALFALWDLLKGDSVGLRGKARAIIGEISSVYRLAPAYVTIAVLLLVVAGPSGSQYRYHTYKRIGGIYVYDRLLHSGIYLQHVDCGGDQ